MDFKERVAKTLVRVAVSTDSTQSRAEVGDQTYERRPKGNE